jgi:hypothetical protein
VNHHLCRFDDSGDGVAFLKLEFVGAAAGDGALDEVAPTRTTTWAMTSPS